MAEQFARYARLVALWPSFITIRMPRFPIKYCAQDQRWTTAKQHRFKPVVKLFTLDAQCIWLFLELDPNGGLPFGLGDLGMGCPELGYVNFIELAAVRGKLGRLVEGDCHFVADDTISAYTEEACAPSELDQQRSRSYGSTKREIVRHLV